MESYDRKVYDLLISYNILHLQIVSDNTYTSHITLSSKDKQLAWTV